MRLICLPHAGGGGNVFNRWIPDDPDIEVLAVTLPGRESRMGEPAHIDVDALTEVIGASADRPYALFGHSMGGLLAVEISRRLGSAGGRHPDQLWLAAAILPGEPGPLTGAADLADHDLIARLSALGGMPTAVVADPAITALFLPTIRADLRWVDAYTYPPGDQLSVPIHAMAGNTDTHPTPAGMARWRGYTSAAFELHVVDGGHFFPQDQATATCARVSASIRTPATHSAPSDR
jgi:surfactin synthase thioesterase subunit